jgi:hypothetical protein
VYCESTSDRRADTTAAIGSVLKQFMAMGGLLDEALAVASDYDRFPEGSSDCRTTAEGR